MTPRRVVVPIEDARSAALLLPVASELARTQGAALRIVHVSDERLTAGEVLRRVGLEAGAPRGSVVDARTGDRAAAIVEAAAAPGTELLVMAGGPLLGAIVPFVHVPVMAVRPGGPAAWPPRRLLLPHDGTPTTSGALAPAIDLARRAGARLDVLHVATSVRPAEAGTLPAPRYADQPQHEFPQWGHEFLDRLGGVASLDDLDVRLTMAHGEAAPEILRAARDADLIVLAWRGDASARHGAVVLQVMGEAVCPVLLLRTPAPEPASVPAPQ
jgi:nucleotide-binding universal stress UspA family protein